MSERKWTENQSNAIKARNGAILVSAAAGSGKTAVLVQRVIERITDTNNPTDADRLLVVTYTRAAASEMKERIKARLNELIKADPFNSVLRRQQMLLEKANISTIHSFCSQIVKENFFNLKVMPGFTVADENELKIIKADALDKVLETLYEENDSKFLDFTNAFSTAKNDNNLKSVVLKLYTFLCSHPFPEKWLNEKEQMYDFDCDITETPWGKIILDYCKSAVDFISAVCMHSLDDCNSYPDDFAKIKELIQDEHDYLSILKSVIFQEKGSWDRIRHTLNSYDSSKRFPALRGLDDHAKLVKDRIKDNRNTVKDTIAKMAKLFSKNEETCREEIYRLSPIIHQLFKTVLLFAREYSNQKRERNILDFNDLEHLTLQVLVKENKNNIAFTDESLEIADRFDEVMVDEYQDANEVQDLIFQAVSRGGRNLFVVGDVKQSIYGFRQAMPEIFIRRKESYALYNRSEDNYPSKIILDKNFRSRSDITKAVNFVFKRLMSEEIGDMAYTDEERLTCGAVYQPVNTPNVSYHMLDLSADEDDNADFFEARYIAGEIKKIVGNLDVTVDGVTRKAEFGDCAILMRSTSSHAGKFVSELINAGVPAMSEDSEKFLLSREIAVMINLLKIIDNPIQDIPLLTVLMSPIYGFTADDLAQIRVNMPKGNLYTALKSYGENGNDKAKRFFKDITCFREFAASNPTDVLINLIYGQTGYMELTAAESGSIGVNNLRLLHKYASSYEKSGYKGLCSFVRYINNLEARDLDLPSAKNNSSHINSVQVMSIHKSKGLEFPICFVAALSRRFNDDKKDEVQLHRDLGLGIRYKDRQTMLRYNTMPRSAVDLALDRESKSEELRVLYVAMTRAREKLYLISSHKNCEKFIGDVESKLVMSNKVDPHIVRSAGNMSIWITACALMHPDGKALRNTSNIDFKPTADGDFKWDIKLVRDFSLNEENSEKPDTEENFNESAETIAAVPESTQNSLTLQEMTENLNRTYAHEQSVNIPQKIAVSEIVHDNSSENGIIFSHPSFLLNEQLSPAQKGTALHTYMQFADFDKVIADPVSELERLVSNGFISRVQADAVDLKKVKNCMESPIMQRCLRSEQYFREYRFTVNISSDIIDGSFSDNNENIIMQGAVDCAFEENGQLVIVDYKTDRINDINILVSRYSKQLELYKFALEQCTGYKVKECYLLSLYLGESIQV